MDTQAFLQAATVFRSVLTSIKPERCRIRHSAEIAAVFDESVARMRDELQSDGAMTRAVPLSPNQTFSGFEMLVLTARNVFQYSWDLANATGQSPDLAPQLATELLEISRTRLVPLRGPGGFFADEFAPPRGSPPADVLAGFLGRSF